MNEEYELILQCYRSGQMSEEQWQAHLDDKDFKSWHYLNVNGLGWRKQDAEKVDAPNFVECPRSWYAGYDARKKEEQPEPAMAGDELSDEEIDDVWKSITGRPCLTGSVAHAFARALLKRVQPASGEDAKRIAWLSENDCMIERLVSTKGTRYRLSWGETWQSDWYDTPSLAIDAAMRQEGQP